MYELKDYLKAINETKQPLLDTEDTVWEKKYPTFIINRCLSMFYDTIMHSNEMNGLHFLPKRMQFHYNFSIKCSSCHFLFLPLSLML